MFIRHHPLQPSRVWILNFFLSFFFGFATSMSKSSSTLFLVTTPKLGSQIDLHCANSPCALNVQLQVAINKDEATQNKKKSVQNTQIGISKHKEESTNKRDKRHK